MPDSAPWFHDRAGPEAKKHAPATLRNRDAILAELRALLPRESEGRATVLEIASGTGEHVVHFARALPWIDWQPSDPGQEACLSITAWIAEMLLDNVAPPLRLDVMHADWQVPRADAVLCSNMVHIAPWAATEALFAGAARLLPPGGALILYGPYLREDVPTAESNLAFDHSLRSRDSGWGLRAVADMDALAEANRFARERLIEMPANNIMLVHRRT